MISVKNLYKTFHTLAGDVEVLKGIDCQIAKGEKVVIVGPSGSGKSTFLRCMNLLEEPTKGEIWFDGQQINAPGVNIDAVRAGMGMVFQHFNLFPHLTVKKNITLAPVMLKKQSHEEAEENAMRLLKRIGLLTSTVEIIPGVLYLSHLSLIIPYAAFSLAMGILISVGFMGDIPYDLDEAAFLDGCGVWGIFFRVILPLMTPAISTLGIYTFLQCWNELLFATVYISDSAKFTLPVGIQQFFGQYTTDWGKIGAGLVIATAPTLIVYVLLSKKIQAGFMAGAVKG